MIKFNLYIINNQVHFVEQNTTKSSQYAKLARDLQPFGIKLFWGFEDNQYRYFAVMIPYKNKQARLLGTKMINSPTLIFTRVILGKDNVLFISPTNYAKDVVNFIKNNLPKEDNTDTQVSVK